MRTYEHKPTALIVDPDLDIATMTAAILNDDGFVATILTDLATLLDVVARLEPDVVLIDIKGYADDQARDAISWLSNRPVPIPVVMFTTSEEMAKTVGVTPVGKKFVAVLRKPFELSQLLDTLHQAIAGQGPLPEVRHVKPSPSVGELLRKQGIKDIQEASDREWVVFRDKNGAQVQIYWWEQADAYYVSKMKPDAESVEDLGKCKTAEEAAQRALGG